MSTQLHDRLCAAIQAVNEANTKTGASDASLAKLRATIDAVPNLQGEVNALANSDAAAFEAWARADGDTAAPTIDAKKHQAAALALVAAQKQAAAANAAITRIESERSKAYEDGVKAQKAIQPIASMIALGARVPELLSEAAEIRTQTYHNAAQIEEAHKLAFEMAHSLPKESPEAHEAFVFATRLGEEIRRRKHESTPADANAIRAELMAEIDKTIDAANTNQETEQ